MVDYAALNQRLFEGAHEAVRGMVEDALAAGRPAREVLEEGLIAGMKVVGEDFKHNRVFVPEVLLAARAMKAGLAVLKPHLATSGGDAPALSGTIVLGTVKGDLHDIGKNLVGMMAEAAGFQVIDLGTNVTVERFAAAIREHRPALVGLSALLTTTMRQMRQTVDELARAGLLDGVKIMIGGAPVTEEYANTIGAHGYAPDAAAAVHRMKELLGTA